MTKVYKENNEGPQAVGECSTQPPEGPERDGSRGEGPSLTSNTTWIGTWTTFNPLKVRSQQGYSLASISYIFASLPSRAQE